MVKRKFGRHGLVRVAAAIALAGLVAACSWGPPNSPAPVILNGAGPGVAGQAAFAPAPMPPSNVSSHQIVVRDGQSLGGIAHAYHVSERAIVTANHLAPPYKLAAGQRLVIPGPGETQMPPPLAAVSSAGPAAAPLAQGRPPPEIIPLDGPLPPKSVPPPRTASSLTPPPEAAAAARPPAEPSAADEARAEPAGAAPLPHGGHFAWPVHGRVLAGYGVTANGSHNDGINIAAPRGTLVTAVDGGTVAYAGNELRGYGNLVLIRHPSGWITAYAHCEELLVKRGDTVSRGQAIAKVGATGGVSEPQLHFELRRGKRAVDPREFLAPAPSAGEAAHQG